ncbi:MAG TPA: adenylate/guanylate cyclase domain-containing protein [Dehalococcoidia bacterium]|nr:adenylate/guanylate cyclase domain-containing protein [Dehalococcoidia bacterium]
MDRDVRYCTTEDGVRIAYCVEGDGALTILALPALNETFSLDHLMPVYPQFYRDLGAGRRVVRFDWRGTGLSAALPAGVPLEAAPLRDMEAVARATAESCVIWAPTITGPAAIEFAVAHPDLVSHLILYDTFATPDDAIPQNLRSGFNTLARANWQMAAQTIADSNGRREFPEEAAQLGDWYYRSEAGEGYLARTQTLRNSDAHALLAQVRVPTLVLHRIADPIILFAAGQILAAGIPDARFVPLEGKGHLFCLGDYGNILSAVDGFLGDRAEKAAVHTRESAFRTVLFTDIVGHAEMMQRLGDAKGRDVLRAHERITRDLLKQFGGTEVKTMGDGFMASFGSVTSAMDCAIALQRAFAAHSEKGEPLQVRVGLNAGEPIEEDGDLFGATVILASRIAARAGPGEILVPDTVRGLLSGKGFVFGDRGEFVPKGFDEGVRLWDVRWRESA